MSLDQWIAAAVARKIGAVQAAGEFFRLRAGNVRPDDLHALPPDRPPDPVDEPPPAP